MGRKRKHDTSSTRPSQNPFASPRSSGRTAKNRSAPGDPHTPAPADFAENNPWVLAAVCTGLLLCTFLAFRPALSRDFNFVNLDDNRYVYENEHVTQGLTSKSMAWAFTSLEFDNWHPLTWLSHMLDRQIFGPESLQHPWGYHLTSILIHAVNVLVLFMALWWMTSALWPSLLVAVLFGLHPLRAESVAWISERKDVLSGLFFLLTLWAYAAYTNHDRSWARYGLVIVLFIVGLMAKPMLVTLPVLLVLLDYWPLGRWQAGTMYPWSGSGRGTCAAGRGERRRGGQIASIGRLVLEKLPLLVLALASGAVTVIAQRGAMKVIDTITFPMRLENALVSYAAYIGEIFYPVNLAPLYPFPEHGVPWPKIVVAVLVLAAITACCVWLRAWRWLAVGWLWYLVALLPVIGLVQVGVQAMADRYTYLPQIGLYIMLAWTAEELTANLPLRRWFWAAALVLLIPVLVQVTAAQTATWKDSETLLTSALKANPEIALAENNLGYIVQCQGQMEQTLGHSEEARKYFDEAFTRYQHAVEIRPRYVEAHINLGNMYMHKGQIDEGMKHYRKAIEIRPDFGQSYVNLGTGLMLRGKLAEAEANFRTALETDSQYVEAYLKLGTVLCLEKKFEEGIAALRKAVEIAPNSPPARQALAGMLVDLERYDEAIPHYEILLQQPATARQATENLGYLYYRKREPRKALEFWTSVLDNNPDSLSVLTMTAWVLATDPDAAVRNGSKAVALAERATRISQGRSAPVLVALAAAYAESGDFTLAAQTIQQANRLPDRPFSAAAMSELLRLYQSGKRFYDGLALLRMPRQ